MLKKTIRRLGALAMILAMAVSVFTVNASATGATANIQFEKSLVVSGDNAELPLDETFNFTVTAAGKSTDTTYDNPGAEAITVSSVKFDKGATTSTKNINVTVNKDYFNRYASDNSTVIGYKVGTYYYTIAETAGSTDGMSYSKATKKLAVQVLADGTCTYYVVADSDAKDDATFENKYTAHKLTVTKKVTGNQGDKNKEFIIYVTINGAAGETYKTSSGDTIESGVQTGIVLKSEESMEIYNLSAGDTYTVVEAPGYADNEGYEVTGNVTTATAIGDEDVEVTIENNKDVDPPTGVITTIAPYALMVVLAGAFAVVFLTRRNRAE
jgi:hypothetical protein